MKKTCVVFTVVSVFFFLFSAIGFGAETIKDTNKSVAFQGGEYTAIDDSILVRLDYPLTNNRDTVYGNYVASPQGGQKLNLDNEKDVLDYAKNIREQLLAIKTDNGLFAVRSVIIYYNQAVITRYPRVEWADIVKVVEAAFKEAGKGKVKRK
jgi:hypothetical protein